MSKDKKLTGIYVEWDTIGLCGIVGESGSGKTSTMRFLLAQLAMSGTGIILIDGHGKMQGQTLAQSCEPLEPSYLLPVVVDDDEIMPAIRLARSIAQSRIDGKDRTKNHIALVIDEFISVLSRLDKSDYNYVVETMILFAGEYRKTNVKAFISAFNWNKDMVGAASIRKMMNTKIVHRVSSETAGMFAISPTMRKVIPAMRVGEAYVIQANLDPVKVYVPKVTTDDLKAMGDRVVSCNKKLYERLLDDIIADNAPVSVVSQVSHDVVSHETLDKWYKEIRNYTKLGYTKTDIIYRVWGVMPGSSKRYKTASRVYDYLRLKM